MDKRTAATIVEHGRWASVQQCGGLRANLRWANLSEANLSGANLRRADLRWANLSGADLRWANLRWANLSEANLSGANLRRADLRRANLSGADLRWANLSGADLSGANLSEADLSGADLSGTQLDPLNIPRLHGGATLNTYRKTVDGRTRIYGWRTRTSAHVGATEYKPNRWYKANALSTCPHTECHPGIYLGGESHGHGQVLVWAYEDEAHYVSQHKGYRARRVYVTKESRTV